MLERAVENYLATHSSLPFFYVTGDADYLTALRELKQAGLETVRLSDFCRADDKFPDIDDMIDRFCTAAETDKFILLGLGEYLALRGESETVKMLRGLKNTTFGKAHVVILLRYANQAVAVLSEEDIRLKSQRVYFHAAVDEGISIVNVKTSQELGFAEKPGIKSLLQKFEDGKTGVLYVKTDLDLSSSVFPVQTITDPYSALKLFLKDLPFPRSFGDDGRWNKLLQEIPKRDASLSEFFEKKHLDAEFENDFYERAWGDEYNNWLYFLALNYYAERIKNPYLKFVVDKGLGFAAFRDSVLNGIIEIPHTAARYKELYAARKKLVKEIPEAEIAAVFLRANEVDWREGIYKYTDNTNSERRAIIQWISDHGIVPEIEDIYPALSSYLRKFRFECGSVSDTLTEYFDRYKRQKVLNVIEPGFEDRARELSGVYTALDTRENAITEIEDKNSAYLYWIDALGVEYLSYIRDLAKQKGLSFEAKIIRTHLPTITTINKGFFEAWEGKKRKDPSLDEIKHKEKGGFDYRKCTAPIHLANELEVIERAVGFAAVELARHTCKSFVIASDHGASRLAVIAQHEEKYETDTKGEHSGRCCKYFDGYNPVNMISENGYVVLTDYGRFRGSRAANVEAHGGATLEEVVIPFITLSLRKQTEVAVKVLDEDKITADRKKGITFMVYISDVGSAESVKAVRDGVAYRGIAADRTHFQFEIPDIKRSGKYNFDLLDGENLISKITIHVKGAVGSSNSAFDDLF